MAGRPKHLHAVHCKCGAVATRIGTSRYKALIYRFFSCKPCGSRWSIKEDAPVHLTSVPRKYPMELVQEAVRLRNRYKLDAGAVRKMLNVDHGTKLTTSIVSNWLKRHINPGEA